MILRELARVARVPRSHHCDVNYTSHSAMDVITKIYRGACLFPVTVLEREEENRLKARLKLTVAGETGSKDFMKSSRARASERAMRSLPACGRGGIKM